METQRNELARRVGLAGGIGIVVGNVVGSGIFVAPGQVALALGDPRAVMLVWVLGGLLALSGALGLAELAAAYPHTGGAYVYLRRAFGARLAFVFGWAELWVIKPTGAAGIAVILAQYATQLVPQVPARVFALAGLLLVYGMNYVSLPASDRAQTALGALKVAGLGVLAALALWRFGVRPAEAAPLHAGWAAAWGAAFVPVLWTYDGWSDVACVAGEVRDPGRRLPQSLILGTLVVVVLYVLVNAAVLAGLDAKELAADPAVLSSLAARLGGASGHAAVTALLLVSTFGSMLAGAITTPRIFYAMARDGLFMRWVGTVHPRFGTPSGAILLIAAVACVYVLTGTFDQIITYFVFVMWAFYALSGLAIFRLRQLEPDTPRPYRVPWYPVGPALFVMASIAMLVSIVVQSRRESLIGLLLVASGLPAYYVWRRGGHRRGPGA
jgi:APA family basic amino acid/polyamine antiporter